MDDKKPVLPFGWIVKQSKTYPDRIYYFNVNTGASSWEFPDLLQHYVSGDTDRTVTPVLSATSFTVDNVSPEKTSIPTTSTQQTSRQPDKHKVSKSSHNEGHDTNSSKDNSVKKWSTSQISETFPESRSRKTMKPHTLSQLKCSHQRIPVHDSDRKSLLKSGTSENRFSERVKSQHQPCPTSYVKKVCEHTESSLKTSSRVKKDLQSDKKEGFSQISQRHLYKKPACIDRGWSGKSLQQNIPSSPRRTTKSHQSLTSKSSLLPSAKLSQAKNPSNICDINKKGSKISPIKFPKESGGKAKSPCSNNSLCLKNYKECSNSVVKDSRIITNVGKNVSENTNKTSTKRAISHDLQTSSKRRKTETEVQCSNRDKPDKKEVPSAETQSKRNKKKESKVKYEESSPDTCITEDRRTVVKSSQSRNNITNIEAARITQKLTPSKYDLSLNKRVSIQSPCEERSPASDIGSDFDRNNNTEYKLFIGDKDKLLSIQSWINNLQDNAGSESPSVDSYSQASLGHVNESVDSGYITNTTIKTCSPPETGWPVQFKEPNATCTQVQHVVDMEIDECYVEEKLQDEELMDIDEVLVEVRQQVSGSGVQNAGSFLTLTDNFTPMKPTSQIITVVVDTNIFISNLQLFETLKDYQLQGTGRAKLCLYIPWIVLRELDVLKEKTTADKRNMSQVQRKARAAISLLKTLFSSKHPRVKGQTPKEADEASQNFRSSCNDDDILQACLQCKNKGLCVVLLTNDNNLIIKALVSKISAFNANDILEGLNKADNKVRVETCVHSTSVSPETVGYVELPATSKQEVSISSKVADGTENKGCMSGGKPATVRQTVLPLSSKPKQSCFADKILKEEKTSPIETLIDDMYCKMKTVLHEALGKILEVEMQKAYDDIWTDIVYRKPPWDLKAILECWKKHWIAVFGLVFPRHLSRNVDNLLTNITRYKGISVSVVKDISEDSSVILEKAASSNMYSARISEISRTMTLMRDLCDKIPTMTAASVPNLEQYLNPQTGPQINVVASSTGCDKTETDCDTSQELMAGEYLSNIWRCIYTYCDEFYRTISTSTDQGILKNIEPVLKVLVSTCLELRKYYAGLLELPVGDLKNREEDFTALCQICNSFFNKLNMQENVPVGVVTPLQLLVLYSKSVYRETLTQFLSKLDEMLKMMYQCLNKLCPDD